jgi:hypothetical protein
MPWMDLMRGCCVQRSDSDSQHTRDRADFTVEPRSRSAAGPKLETGGDGMTTVFLVQHGSIDGMANGWLVAATLGSTSKAASRRGAQPRPRSSPKQWDARGFHLSVPPARVRA